MSTKTLHISPRNLFSTRRLVTKLNPSNTLSKALIAKAFLKAPKLTTSTSCLDEHNLLVSQASFQTAPTALRDQRLSESFTSISVDNGLSPPTRRPTNSPRRSPRRTLSSSQSKRKKPLYLKSKRLCHSCPDINFDIPTMPSIALLTASNGNNKDGPPEQDAALGKESMRHIESHKRFFQERRPNRRKVKFESAKETQISESRITQLSVSDLELPVDHECSRRLSRTKQFEIIRELERDIRASTRQVERLEEMIEYEAEIAKELERENLILRRRIMEFPSPLPSRRDLELRIREAEAMIKSMKFRNTPDVLMASASNTISVGRIANV